MYKRQRYPSSKAKFSKPDGSLYELGDNWMQPDLAHTLEMIKENGRDGFYKGENAARLASYMRAYNGLITEEDLEKYEAVEWEPIR